MMWHGCGTADAKTGRGRRVDRFIMRLTCAFGVVETKGLEPSTPALQIWSADFRESSKGLLLRPKRALRARANWVHTQPWLHSWLHHRCSTTLQRWLEAQRLPRSDQARLVRCRAMTVAATGRSAPSRFPSPRSSVRAGSWRSCERATIGDVRGRPFADGGERD